MLGLRLRRSIQHQAHTRAIEEAQAWWRLEEESHSQDVAVEGDGPRDIGDRDGNLSDLGEAKVRLRRAGHERSSCQTSATCLQR